MISRTPFEVSRAFIKDGMDHDTARKLRRELRKARAQGILDGVCAGLRPGDVAIDCGAHKGEVTTALAATGAQVHAFEPDPDTLIELKAVCAGQDNVTIHPHAVGTKAGSAQLFRSKVTKHNAAKGATGSTLTAEAKTADAQEAVDVDVIDFPTFLADEINTGHRVAFLKMDIEGAELELVEHLLDTDLLPQIGLTVVETHRWLLPKAADRYDRLHVAARERPELNLYLGWI